MTLASLLSPRADKSLLLELSVFVLPHLFPLPPSNTLYLFPLAWLLLRRRHQGWYSVGFTRPANWKRLAAISAGAGLAYFALTTWVLEPLLRQAFGDPVNLNAFASLRGNPVMLAIVMIASWALGGFGEEMIYRGYLYWRVASAFTPPALQWTAGALTSALLFGLGHAYQGLTGAALSVIFGLVSTSHYTFQGRNLWSSIIFHGVYNMPGITILYLGIPI